MDLDIKETKGFSTLYENEEAYILKALKHFEGSKEKTARALGIQLKTLYCKLIEYGEITINER